MTETSQRPSEPAPPARGSIRLLADPIFGRFIVARLFSTAGIWVMNIVSAILVFDLSRSAFIVGLVSVAQFLPQMVLAPWSGSLADRWDRRLQLIIGRTLVVLGSGWMAVWIGITGVEGLPGPWPVIASAFVVGFGFLLSSPAQESLLPSLIRPDELAAAIALNAVPPTLARTLGPAAGAIIATSMGPAAGYAITAATNVLFIVVLLSMRLDSAVNGSSRARGVKAALRYLKQDRGVLLLLAGVFAVGIGADPAITLTPPLAESFDRGPETVGLLASAYGFGSLAVFLILGRMRRRYGLPRASSTGLIMLALGLAATGSIPSLPLAVVSFVLAGAGMTIAFTTLTTRLQRRCPDEFRGRIMALWAMAFLGTRPLAAALNGFMADHFGVAQAFVLVAGLVVVLTWFSRPAALARTPAPH